MEGIACKCILVYSECTKYNDININFCCVQKRATNRTGYQYYSQLVGNASQKISDIWIVMAGNC